MGMRISNDDYGGWSLDIRAFRKYTNLDQNIIAELILDKAGRKLNLRDPRNNVTTYIYDGLNRRVILTIPLIFPQKQEFDAIGHLCL